MSDLRAAVEALADKCREASEATDVLGRQVVSVEYVETYLRAALAAHSEPAPAQADGDLADVLAAHVLYTVTESDGHMEYPIGRACSCGWGREGGSDGYAHRAHLADVLAAREQAARADELRKASHFTTDAEFEFRDLADVRDWLRARADRMTDQGDRHE